MPYEYFNPHGCAIDCSCRMPIGTIRVLPNECLPTPAQEEEGGITANILQQFECENLLHPTPPRLRRRLLQEEGIEVPEDLIAATDYLPEFGGKAAVVETGEGAAEDVKTTRKRRGKTKHILDRRDTNRPNTSLSGLEGVSQQMTDKLCSSGKCKNVENP